MTTFTTMKHRPNHPVLKKRGIRIEKPAVTSSIYEGLQRSKVDSPGLSPFFKGMIGATYVLSMLALGLVLVSR